MATDIDELLEKLDEQDKELQRLAKSPRVLGTVLLRTPDGLFVNINGMGSLMLEDKPEFALTPGDQVLMIQQTQQIIAKVKTSIHLGGHSAIVSTIKEGWLSCSVGGSERWVSVDDSSIYKEGDNIILDVTMTMVQHNMGQEDMANTLSKVPTTSWEDIGGLEEVKRQLIDAIENPYTHKELYESYNKKPTKGVLLYGPPGCGKTMLGRALARSIAMTHHKDNPSEIPDSFFMLVKGPELNSMYVGEGERKIRDLFDKARKHKAQYGYPAMIFIDEAESVLRDRSTNGPSNGVRESMVTQFLTEMDGIEESGAIVVLATNRQEDLDPAVTRDGRIDYKVRVTRPTAEDTETILIKNLGDVPVPAKTKIADLAKSTAAAMFSGKFILDQVNIDGEEVDFCLRDIINGAMIVGVVERAKQAAIRRDIDAKAKKASGVSSDDLLNSVISAFEQNIELNHKDAIEHFKDTFNQQEAA